MVLICVCKHTPITLINVRVLYHTLVKQRRVDREQPDTHRVFNSTSKVAFKTCWLYVRLLPCRPDLLRVSPDVGTIQLSTHLFHCSCKMLLRRTFVIPTRVANTHCGTGPALTYVLAGLPVFHLVWERFCRMEHLFPHFDTAPEILIPHQRFWVDRHLDPHAFRWRTLFSTIENNFGKPQSNVCTPTPADVGLFDALHLFIQRTMPNILASYLYPPRSY